MENKPNIWIIILTSLLIIVMMIPITALVITPSKEPQPLNTPIYDLGNMSLNEVFNIDNDTIFTELNNHSLREVFEDTSLFQSLQLVTNGDFSDGTTGWLQNTTLSAFTVNSGIASFLASNQFAGIYRTSTVISGHKIYAVSRIKANGNVRFRNHETYTQHSGSGNYKLISSIHIATQTNHIIGVRDFRISDWSQVDIDYLYAFNISTLIANKQYSPIFNTTFDLMSDADIQTQMDEFVAKPYLFIDYTTLGIDTLTVSQMDDLYNLYDGGTYSIEVYETLYNFGLSTNQWQYYYDLYVYYNSL